MDLRRHLQVISRFRVLVASGVLFACGLAALTAVKPTFDGGPKVEWRSQQKWMSKSTLFVTQTGFPWGRVTLPDSAFAPSQGVPGQTPEQPTTKGDKREFGAPERFVDLAILYSYLANSTEVKAMIQPRPADGQIVIEPVLNPGTGSGLPLLSVSTTAPTGALARRVNAGTVEALRRYLRSEQDRWDIPNEQRVRIQVLNPPGPAALSEGRSAMTALIAFALGLALTLGLAYLLESLFPRRPEAAVVAEPEPMELFPPAPEPLRTRQRSSTAA